MQLYKFVAVTALVSQISAASNATTKTSLNGWYPCSGYTFSDQGSVQGQKYECATFSAPLCYPGVCETPQFADPTIDVFVKRMLATKGNPKTATNVWLFEGGPGYSSSALESPMTALFGELDGAVNVYTMDQRGSGRSTFLDCVSAQATTTGSPLGKEIEPSEVATCAQSLENKYGDLASFSTTSAANDVVTFMSKFTNGASTILFGTSYGTILVERIMHLDPPGVTGYVMDGVATTSGAPGDKFFFMSKRDNDFGEVGDHFLTLCTLDADCKRHFKSPNTLHKTVRGVLANFDKNPNSTCAPLIKSVDDDSYLPSTQLRVTLGTMIMDSEVRKFIPPLIFRLKRCSKADVAVLKQFATIFKEYDAATAQEDAFYSPLLFYLVSFSELWENPQPSLTVMEDRFAKASTAAGNVEYLDLYCAFSKEKSPACANIKESKYAAHGIIYDHDKYWNKTATIPQKASALLLSSKLDAQTPHKYAEYLLESLRGNQKELVTFNYSTHGSLIWTQMETGYVTCGIKILASYVRSNGDLKGLDRSCVDEMPAFNLTAPKEYRTSYFGTDDVYDGVYDEQQPTEATTTTK